MSDIKNFIINEPFLAVGGALLEGPAFDENDDQLRWVDIKTEEIHVLKLSEGPQSLQKFTVSGNTIGTIASIAGSKDLLLVGAKYGFSTFNKSTGELVQLRSYFGDDVDITQQKRFRANDGAIDARGRMIQGIMIDEKVEDLSPSGMLIQLNLDGTMRRLVEGVICPNGLGWNRANTLMYWAESASGNLYVFDYDIDTGDATNQRVFFHLDPDDNTNVPDGLVVDEEDHIWLAVWGESKVLRLSPEGCVVAKIELPTRFVTCPVFVGSDLFITTAAERDPETFPDSALYGGHLYRCHVGVKGLPKFKSRPVTSYNR